MYFFNDIYSIQSGRTLYELFFL